MKNNAYFAEIEAQQMEELNAIYAPLFQYCAEGNKEGICQWVSQRPHTDFYFKDKKGWDVIFYACAHERLAVFEYFLFTHHFKIKKTHLQFIQTHCSQAEQFFLLVEKKKRLDKNNLQLYKLAKRGQFEAVRALFQSCSQGEIDIHFSHPKDWNTPVIVAACEKGLPNQRLNLVQYLLASDELKEHANIYEHNEERLNALLLATFHGHLKIVQYLLSFYKEQTDIHTYLHSVDENHKNALHYACMEGHFDIIRYLLESTEIQSHSNIMQTDGTGKNALMWSTIKGRLDILKYLLSFNSVDEPLDLYACDVFGEDIFSFACSRHYWDIAQYLIVEHNIQFDSTRLQALAQHPEYHVVFDMIKARDLNHMLHEKLNTKTMIGMRKI